MNYTKRQEISKNFKARTLSRNEYQVAYRAVRTAMQPQKPSKYRTIDDSALTLAIRLFGAEDGKRTWAKIRSMRRSTR